MMVLKLDSSNFLESEYSFFAIHTDFEAYRVAFLLNKTLQINLCCCDKELFIPSKKGDVHFSRFEYVDEEKDRSYNLIENKKDVTTLNIDTKKNLFTAANLSLTKRFFLLPEFKKVDFFLKIENKLNNTEAADALQKIQTINGITAVYAINTENIKSKNNLIFY